jgi:2-polyprenyl-3-methyl-5-hydroxy-6-metoxy-1,4-benzoquinol methylase
MVLKDVFDENYWKDKKFSDKYYWQSLIYLDHFEKNMPELGRSRLRSLMTVFDYGCGPGYFVHAFRYFGANASGYDLSKWAIVHPYGLAKGHLSNKMVKTADLVICYDVLEHVPEDEIAKVIDELVSITGRFLLLSICMSGDPNFDRDITHRMKRTKVWWAHLFTDRGLIQQEVPEHFMFRDQLLIFRRDRRGRR